MRPEQGTARAGRGMCAACSACGCAVSVGAARNVTPVLGPLVTPSQTPRGRALHHGQKLLRSSGCVQQPRLCVARSAGCQVGDGRSAGGCCHAQVAAALWQAAHVDYRHCSAQRQHEGQRKGAPPTDKGERQAVEWVGGAVQSGGSSGCSGGWHPAAERDACASRPGSCAALRRCWRRQRAPRGTQVVQAAAPWVLPQRRTRGLCRLGLAAAAARTTPLQQR